MKLLLFNLFMVCYLQGAAQLVNETISFQHEKNNYAKGSKEFTAFKKTFRDSLNPNSFIHWSKNNSQLVVNPVLDLQVGVKSGDDRFAFRSGLGLSVRFKKGNWNLGLTYLRQEAKYMDYQSSFIQATGVVPSMNVARRNENRFASDFINGFLNYKTNSIFDLELGYGRNFIGDGYRSLLFSDFGKSYPYFKVSANFWKIQYSMMISIHQDIFQVEGINDLHRRKYVATHYLDWKIADWLSIGLFESIIWQDEEENFKRGFDVNYLNPVIFFRPVEFSVGSSDNALVGTNLKFTVAKNHHLYFQLVFDEFLLDEIRADVRQWLNPDDSIRSGWWANKYAVQLGYKGFDLFDIQGLRAQLEFNVARPFTYSHSSPTQSFSNFNLPLAHPLGANFEELVTKLDYYKKRFALHFQWNHYRQGRSVNGVNYGENLQLSNTSRVQDFENEIGQGNKNKVDYIKVEAAYLLKESWDTWISLSLISRNSENNFSQNEQQMVSISIKSQLYNQYFDY